MMAIKKPAPEVEFINIELKFDLDWYLPEDKELPDAAQCFVWLDEMAHNFTRFGLGYSDYSSAPNASATYQDVKQGEKRPCVTQHGKSTLRAVQKLWVLHECLGYGRLPLETVRENIEQLETYVQEKVKRAR